MASRSGQWWAEVACGVVGVPTEEKGLPHDVANAVVPDVDRTSGLTHFRALGVIVVALPTAWNDDAIVAVRDLFGRLGLGSLDLGVVVCPGPVLRPFDAEEQLGQKRAMMVQARRSGGVAGVVDQARAWIEDFCRRRLEGVAHVGGFSAQGQEMYVASQHDSWLDHPGCAVACLKLAHGRVDLLAAWRDELIETQTSVTLAEAPATFEQWLLRGVVDIPAQRLEYIEESLSLRLQTLLHRRDLEAEHALAILDALIQRFPSIQPIKVVGKKKHLFHTVLDQPSWRNLALRRFPSFFADTSAVSAPREFAKRSRHPSASTSDTPEEVCSTLGAMEDIGLACDRDAQGGSLLWQVFTGYQWAVMKGYVLHFGVRVLDDLRDEKGNAVLHERSRHPLSHRFIRPLLDLGVAAAPVNRAGETPLDCAAGVGGVDACRALLESGAYADEQVGAAACRTTDPTILALLRSHRAREVIRKSDRLAGGVRPLHE